MKQTITHIFKPDIFENNVGLLGVVEASKNIPFEIKRIYYLYGSSVDEERGVHGHKELQQVMICLNGCAEIETYKQGKTEKFLLNSPDTALYVSKGSYRRVVCKNEDTVLLVLASSHYDADDYIFDYDEFIEWEKNNT